MRRPREHAPLRLSKTEAAAAFSVTEQTLTARLKREDIAPGPDNRFSIVELARAIYGDLETAVLRQARAKAELLEAELRRVQGELLPAVEVEREWSNVILTTRTKILALANKVVGRLAYAADETEMRTIIEKEVDEALTELSRPMYETKNDPTEKSLSSDGGTVAAAAPK